MVEKLDRERSEVDWTFGRDYYRRPDRRNRCLMPQLVEDAHLAPKWWSVQIAVAGAVLSVGSVVFPGVLGFINPIERPRTYLVVSIAFLLASIVGRLLDQKKLDNA